MFKAIDVTRSWPKTGMTSKKWLSVPVRTMDIRILVATQDGIYIHPLIDPDPPVGSDHYPHVIFWNRVYYLEDGHHRVVRAAMQGLWQIQARVLYVE